MTNRHKAKYRVVLNPTGANYGVTGQADVFTQDEALAAFETFLAHLETHGGREGFVMIDDSPEFGGQSSDVLLRARRGSEDLGGFENWIDAWDVHRRHVESEPVPHTLTVNDDETVTVEFDGWYTIEGVSHYATVDDLEKQITRIVFHKENV